MSSRRGSVVFSPANFAKSDHGFPINLLFPLMLRLSTRFTRQAALASLLALTNIAAAGAAEKPPTIEGEPVPSILASAAEEQPWQARRAKFAKLTQALQSNDAIARKEFERIVRQFEQTPFELTPLESMDLLGAVFVPQAGLEKILPVVAAHAALGLYDAYRFASPQGQSELMLGEQFLKRPLVLAGAAQAASSRRFLQENASLAAALVQQGLALAEAERLAPAYDNQWATALGRGKDLCGPDVACPKFEQPKREEWPAIWQRVREQVSTYYTVEPAPASQTGPAALK